MKFYDVLYNVFINDIFRPSGLTLNTTYALITAIIFIPNKTVESCFTTDVLDFNYVTGILIYQVSHNPGSGQISLVVSVCTSSLNCRFRCMFL